MKKTESETEEHRYSSTGTGKRRSGSSAGLKIACAVLVVILIALAVPIISVLGNASQSSNSLHGTASISSSTLNDTGTDVLVEEAPQALRISLVGDVNFTDGWSIDTAHANDDSVAAVFSPEVLEHLQSADVSYANHEFTMSNRGEPLNKYYTFRADPNRVGYWTQLGVDVVGLANNHAYDYGEEAFLDTLDTLQAQGIAYIGAGRNLEEAMAPAYFTVDGYTIALVAADRSQKGDEPRAVAADNNTPGVLFCFDDELFVAAVARAQQTADYVIAIPHWGTEQSTVLEPEQIALSRRLIDAGADAVVGAHPHVLQGVEFYQGKLIAYSLGNFWFNAIRIPTAILNIEIVEGEPRFSITPALQAEQQVFSSQEISDEVLGLMRQLSPEVEIDDNGYITAK